MTMEKKYYVRFTVIVLFVAFVIWLHYAGIKKYITFEQLKAHSERLNELVESHYTLVALSYVGIYIAAVAISLPAAFLFTIAGGFLFGTVLGTLYSVIGSTLGAMLAFWIVRYGVGDFIQNRYASSLASFNRSVERHGAAFLVFIHYMAFVPFFLINILAGMTTITSWTFFWTTFVGLVPISFIYAFVGSRLQEITRLQDIFSFNFIVALLLIALIGLVPLIFSYGSKVWQKIDKQ